MARPPHIQFPGAVYHVLKPGTVRKRLFRAAADYQWVLDHLSEASAR